MTKSPVLHALLSMAGDGNTITIHKAVVEFVKTFENAAMLEQLMYWTPKSKKGGWIAKSDAEWKEELHLSRYAVRQSRQALTEMGLIETKLMRFNGAPTMHYLLKTEELARLWEARFVENEQSDCPKTDNPLSENEQSLTETTTEITQLLPAEKPSKVSRPEINAMVYALQDTTKMNASINWGMLAKSAKKIVLAGYTPEQVRQVFCDGGAWYEKDWRGQKGQPPKPTDIEQNLSVLLAVETKVLTNTTGGLYG